MGPCADLYALVRRDDPEVLVAFLRRYVPGWQQRVWQDNEGDDISGDALVRQWAAICEQSMTFYAYGDGLAPDVVYAMIGVSPWDGRVLGISIPAVDTVFPDGSPGTDVPPEAEAALLELLSTCGSSAGLCTVEEPPAWSEEEWDQDLARWLSYRSEWQTRWATDNR